MWACMCVYIAYTHACSAVLPFGFGHVIMCPNTNADADLSINSNGNNRSHQLQFVYVPLLKYPSEEINVEAFSPKFRETRRQLKSCKVQSGLGLLQSKGKPTRVAVTSHRQVTRKLVSMLIPVDTKLANNLCLCPNLASAWIGQTERADGIVPVGDRRPREINVSPRFE